MDFTPKTTTNTNKLKQLLVGLLRSSSLLTSSCNPSTTNTLASTSSSRALLTDAIHEPIFVSNRFDQFNSLHRATVPLQRQLDLKTMIKNESILRKNGPNKKLSSNPYGFTSSSHSELTDNNHKMFTSDDEEEDESKLITKLKCETENFLSSKSFSSDSTEFYQCPKVRRRRTRKGTRRGTARKAKVCDNWGQCRGFKPLVSFEELGPLEEEQRRAGFAVLKKSSDPYVDFRSSMSEMIVERRIFGAEDLERLLQSYLSLNARKHHPVIIQAFSDIWITLRLNYA